MQHKPASAAFKPDTNLAIHDPIWSEVRREAETAAEREPSLGGNGKDTGDRHPKIGDNVLLAAGAKVLGNIRVGRCSKVAAGSVVLIDVPENKTVAGVPARIVGDSGCPEPARSMDQRVEPHDCGCGG